MDDIFSDETSFLSVNEIRSLSQPSPPSPFAQRPLHIRYRTPQELAAWAKLAITHPHLFSATRTLAVYPVGSNLDLQNLCNAVGTSATFNGLSIFSIMADPSPHIRATLSSLLDRAPEGLTIRLYGLRSFSARDLRSCHHLHLEECLVTLEDAELGLCLQTLVADSISSFPILKEIVRYPASASSLQYVSLVWGRIYEISLLSTFIRHAVALELLSMNLYTSFETCPADIRNVGLFYDALSTSAAVRTLSLEWRVVGRTIWVSDLLYIPISTMSDLRNMTSISVWFVGDEAIAEKLFTRLYNAAIPSNKGIRVDLVREAVSGSQFNTRFYGLADGVPADTRGRIYDDYGQWPQKRSEVCAGAVWNDQQIRMARC